MQTKTTMKCCIIFTRMSIIKSKRTQNKQKIRFIIQRTQNKQKNRKAENTEKWTLPSSKGGNAKWYTSCGKQSHSPPES